MGTNTISVLSFSPPSFSQILKSPFLHDGSHFLNTCSFRATGLPWHCHCLTGKWPCTSCQAERSGLLNISLPGLSPHHCTANKMETLKNISALWQAQVGSRHPRTPANFPFQEICNAFICLWGCESSSVLMMMMKCIPRWFWVFRTSVHGNECLFLVCCRAVMTH